jgi:hypothetical protein
MTLTPISYQLLKTDSSWFHLHFTHAESTRPSYTNRFYEQHSDVLMTYDVIAINLFSFR